MVPAALKCLGQVHQSVLKGAVEVLVARARCPLVAGRLPSIGIGSTAPSVEIVGTNALDLHRKIYASEGSFPKHQLTLLALTSADAQAQATRQEGRGSCGY
jgi:hypothetical protein